MKIVKIIPRDLKGEIHIPPSKSLCHRAVISAALAKGQSIITNVTLSKDIIATIEGVQALGAEVEYQDGKLIILGGHLASDECITIACRESGSTLRFLIPIGLVNKNSIRYIGEGNLSSRPLGPYLDIFKEQGIYHSSNSLPMEVIGRLKPGIFTLNGSVSSQFLSGLMFSLPLLESDSTITVSTALESRGYIDLTIDALKSFGINIENDNYKHFYIKGNQYYKPTQVVIEGDFSQAAFWLAAGALAGEVSCTGLKLSSLQSDKAIIDILNNAGVALEICNDFIKVQGSKIQAFEADVSQCPDIAPILAVVAALSTGTSRITGAARLRIKECDRLKAITSELTKLGARIHDDADSLTIEGADYLQGGEVDSWGDHRIAMALAIASIKCKNPVIIHNSSVVDKSYPNFFNDFIKLGGNLNERNLG